MKLAPVEFAMIPVIEADIQGLYELQGLCGPQKSPVSLYSKTLLYFLQGDLASLRRNAVTIEEIAGEGADFAEFSAIVTLTRLRIHLLEQKFDETLVEKALGLTRASPQWRGELLFVVAAYYFDQRRYQEASGYFLKAEHELQKTGASRKALKAFSSHIAALSWIYPDQPLVREYFEIYRKSRKAGETVSAAMALLNLSREYQKLGAIVSAFRVGERGLSLLKGNIGGLAYYYLMLQSAHLLLDLGRFPEAMLRFELCASGRFPEVIAARKILNERLCIGIPQNSHEAAFPEPSPSPTWRERREHGEMDSDSRIRLGALEEKLLRFLCSCPRKKSEICRFLYGDKMKEPTIDARFKSLIERIRNKLPGVLIYDSGRYSIKDSEIHK
jgi:tetratricopeptide (TPR) repeat protein